jgi:antitoxin component HigA of HigAB toxin-antitoxin module
VPKMVTTGRKDDYLELVQSCPLKKIRTESEHAQALKASGRLIGLQRKLTAGESQYLGALVILIREYEHSHHDARIAHARGLDVLAHLLAERRMTQRDLAKLLGVGESAASMILAGKRELTKSHIATLARHFGIGVAAFF